MRKVSIVLIATTALTLGLVASASADSVVGTNGADHFGGNSQANRIDGGGGTDEAFYGNAASNYSVVNNGGGSWTVTNLSNSSDVDQLLNIERVVFSDGTILLV